MSMTLGKKRSKYNATPTYNAEGVRFDSKAEAARDAELNLLERAGEIKGLDRQPKFPLVIHGVKVGTYIADWQYWERVGNSFLKVVEDKKGVKTPVFKLKFKLAQALYPSINVWRVS